MPKTVNVEGVGAVAFPDDASDEDVLKAVNDFASPAPEAPLQRLDTESQAPGAPPLAIATSDQRILDEARNRVLLREHLKRVESPVSFGTRESAVSGIQAVSSPEGLAWGAALATVPVPAAAALLGQTLSHVPEQVREIQRARLEGDRYAYYKGVGNLAQSGFVIAGTGRGVLSELRPPTVPLEPPVILPRTRAALAEEPTTTTEPAPPGEPGTPQPSPATEVPSALQQEAETPVRDVLKPGGESQRAGEVPANVPSEEAGSRGGAVPGDAGSAQAQAQPALPLNEPAKPAAPEVPAAQPVEAPAPAEVPAPLTPSERVQQIRKQATPLAFSDKRMAQLRQGAPLNAVEIRALKSGRYSVHDELLKARPDLFQNLLPAPPVAQTPEASKLPSDVIELDTLRKRIAEAASTIKESTATPQTGEQLADSVMKALDDLLPKRGETPEKSLLMEFGISRADAMALTDADAIAELRAIARNPEGWKIVPGTYKATQLDYLLKQAAKPGHVPQKVSPAPAEASAPAPEAPKPAPAQEPWQMTKAEGDKWVDANMVNAVKTDKGRVIARNVEHGDLMPALEESGSTFKNPNARGWSLIGKDASESYIGVQDVEAAKGDFHKAYVMKALREGKAVPPEVLADYPDLAPPAGAAPEGPGAAPRGFGPYPAAQQLSDSLNAAPPVGTRARVAWGERKAAAWAAGKDAFTKAVAKAANVTQTIQGIARGVRSETDLTRRVGEFDFALQKSSAQSHAAQRAMKRQMPDVTDRSAAAVLIDSERIADDPANPAAVRQVIADSLALMPRDTPAAVRRAYERALDPSLDVRQFAESLKQYFGIREQDAINSDLFDDGLRSYFTHIWKNEANMPAALKTAMVSDRVSTYFQFAKQRKLGTFIEGIIEGKTPVLDPADVVPFYNYGMDRAIASRTLVKAFSDLDAKDGRPLVAPSGIGTRIEGADPAVIIRPQAKGADIRDYRAVDHPAMRKWKWATQTEEGAPVMLQGDLLVHPEAYERLARMMDKGRLTPSDTMRLALAVGREVKGLKLGAVPSLFHQIHVGSHALFHWTKPFSFKGDGFTPDGTINWDAPFTQFAVEQGHLKIGPSPGELNEFMEGAGAGGVITRNLPWARAYSQWLFGDYIPRLKLATFQNVFERSKFARDTGIAGVKPFKVLTDEDLATRAGDAVNNAYGELNHLFLGEHGRSPRLQRALRATFLAPDFGEARLRFAEKALTRYGHEERLAFATMAATLYIGARIANSLSHGDPEWDMKNAFRVKSGEHWWSMRSVAGDIIHAIDKPQQFIYVRLNPTTSRTLWDMLAQRDVNTGQKLTPGDTLRRLMQQPIPMPLGSLARDDQKFWEGLVQSMGVSAQRDTPEQDIRKLAADWSQTHGFGPTEEFIPTEAPTYGKLRRALRLGHEGTASKLLDGLRTNHSDKQIEAAMAQQAERPFTRSEEHESMFVATLSPDQRRLYLKAREEQINDLREFYKLLVKPRRK